VILANHRRVAPFGVAGGAPGAVGRNWVERSDGRREEFGATAAVEMAPGDVFVIETPGGGGYGAPKGSPEGEHSSAQHEGGPGNPTASR
jgi:5-oxoprolinase (ATP-hydrolysing)